jgi:hypothetical protein
VLIPRRVFVFLTGYTTRAELWFPVLVHANDLRGVEHCGYTSNLAGE